MSNSRNPENVCACCEFSSPIEASDACLCKKRGVVRADAACRKFSPDIFKLSPESRAPVAIDRDLDFSIGDE